MRFKNFFRKLWPSRSSPTPSSEIDTSSRANSDALSPRQHRAPPKHIAAAHYFGDHSPISFWCDQRMERVPEQMARLRDDGFNCIILVLPWPLFQSTIHDSTLSPWYVARLKFVLSEVERLDLHVILRLGFVHQPVWETYDKLLERPFGVFLNEATRTGFVRMCTQLIHEASRSSGYIGAFFSWEELWSVMEIMPKQTESRRLELAHDTEFHEFLPSRFTIDELNALYRTTHADFKQFPLPEWLSEAMPAMVAFFDFRMRDVLDRIRAQCDTMTIEIRIDAMPVLRGDQGYDWHFHDVHRDATPFRAVYWGPFFGSRNEGEALSAEQAMGTLRYTLANVDAEQRRDVFLEQFNFVDNHLIYSPKNARINPAEMPEFFALAATFIRDHCAGYGIWATRDYRENWIGNACFQLGAQAWATNEGARFDDTRCYLQPGGYIEQSITPALKAQTIQSGYQDFVIEIIVDTSVSLASPAHSSPITCTWNHAPLDLMWDQRHLCWRSILAAQSMAWNDASALRVSASGSGSDTQTITLRSVVMCGFVQRLGVYDEYGERGAHWPLVRGLNAALSAEPTVASP
jgi:hypothetical protein